MLDPDRRGLERCYVWRHHGIRRPFLFWNDRVLLLHHPLHLRKLYPPAVMQTWTCWHSEYGSCDAFVIGCMWNIKQRAILYRTPCLDILLNVFLAIAVDNLADAESLNTEEGEKKGWHLRLWLFVANRILKVAQLCHLIHYLFITGTKRMMTKITRYLQSSSSNVYTVRRVVRWHFLRFTFSS